MRPITQIALSVLASSTLVATAVAAPVLEGGRKFTLTLTAGAEPHGGDTNASGTAWIVINPGQKRVCWEITTTGVNPEYSIVAGTGAHIHSGAAGATGGVVVSLGVVLNGTSSGCTTRVTPTGDPLTTQQLAAIVSKPQNYYVNLHWADLDPSDGTLPNYSAGALRAQLR